MKSFTVVVVLVDEEVEVVLLEVEVVVLELVLVEVEVVVCPMKKSKNPHWSGKKRKAIKAKAKIQNFISFYLFYILHRPLCYWSFHHQGWLGQCQAQL